MYDETPPPRIPLVPLDRRAYAYLLDFVAVWLLSSFVTGWTQMLVFLGVWWGWRVVTVEVNQGQSVGHWAFDMKVIDWRSRRIPGILELTKREGLLGGFSWLAMVGLNINFANAISMLLLMAPLLIDGGLVLSDDRYNQALHDRLGGTIVIRAKRGFSLDLRLKRGWYLIKRQWLSQRRR